MEVGGVSERVSGPEDGQKEERKTRPKLAVAILLRLREAAEDAMWEKGKKEDTRRRQGRYAGIGQRPGLVWRTPGLSIRAN